MYRYKKNSNIFLTLNEIHLICYLKKLNFKYR